MLLNTLLICDMYFIACLWAAYFLELFTAPILQGFSSWHLCATVSLHYSSPTSFYSQIKTQHMQPGTLSRCPRPLTFSCTVSWDRTPSQTIPSLQPQLKSQTRATLLRASLGKPTSVLPSPQPKTTGRDHTLYSPEVVTSALPLSLGLTAL